MKKLVLLATILVAGLMNAKTGEKAFVFEKQKYPWVTVVSSCGVVCYLWAPNYESMEDLWEASETFDSAKCPE